MNQNPSAITNLNHLSDRLLKMCLLLVVIGIVIGTATILITRQQIKRIRNLESELSSLSESQLNSASLQQFISKNESRIAELQHVFPNQGSIIQFLSAVEVLVQTIDEKGTVKFSAVTPSKATDELMIPLIINFRGNTGEALELLKQLEQLPYIIHITSVEIKAPSGQFADTEVILGGRVYVQDPFIQP